MVVVTQGGTCAETAWTYTHRSACVNDEICMCSVDCTNASFLTWRESLHCTIVMQDVLIGRGCGGVHRTSVYIFLQSPCITIKEQIQIKS